MIKGRYKDEYINITSLFYMDDGLIIAENKTAAIQIVNLIEKVSAKCGLRLNRKKCKIMIYNSKDKSREIADIDVTSKIRYLGMDIINERKWHKEQKTRTYVTALKMTNILYSILGTSCNRMLVGKTFWKGLALSCFMYGQEIVLYNETELQELQRMDNKAYRMILQLPTYTASSFLRGEIGASSVKARDMKVKILYVKHAMKEDGNGIVRNIMERELENTEGSWMKKVKDYMIRLNLNIATIIGESKEQLKKRIEDWDTKEWRTELESKTTLYKYRSKKDICEESWFRNGEKYSIMMRARSDTLKLQWREWATESGKMCRMCKTQVETLDHFLVDCSKLQETRMKYIELQWPKGEKVDELINRILLLDERNRENSEYYIDMLWDLWMERKKQMSAIELIDAQES